MRSEAKFPKNLSRLASWTRDDIRSCAHVVRTWMRGPRDRDSVDEATQQLLCELDDLRRTDPRAFEDLCGRTVRELESFLRTRVRWIESNADPLREPRHAIRQHVAAILAEDALPEADGLPVSLRSGGRFSRDRVREAIAEIVQRDGRAWGPVSLTSTLLVLYRFEIEPSGDDGHGRDPEDDFRRARDGERLAAQVLARLDPRQRRALALRLDDAGLTEIGNELGVGRSRANDIVQGARAVLRAVIEFAEDGDRFRGARRRSVGTQRAALTALRALLRRSA